MKIKALIIFSSTIIGIGLVMSLFVLSERNMHRNNSFIRRVLPHTATKLKTIDLKFNSYYIAGMTDKTIYLGNSTAPLSMTEISLETYHIKRKKIILDQMDLAFRSVRIEIKPPYFFVADGSIPIIFRGNINNWKAQTLTKNNAYFSVYTTADSTTFGIRSVSSNNQERILGVIAKNTNFKAELSSDLLTKQVDGYFDVDGQLLWNQDLHRFLYIYYYRNEYLIFNSKLNLNYVGKTIDTVEITDLDVVKLKKTNQKKLTGNPIIVNKIATTKNEFLLINSERLGKYEPKNILKIASIIDVYNLKDNTYRFSFYTFFEKTAKIKSMNSENNTLALISDNKLIIYQLQNNYFK